MLPDISTTTKTSTISGITYSQPSWKNVTTNSALSSSATLTSETEVKVVFKGTYSNYKTSTLTVYKQFPKYIPMSVEMMKNLHYVASGNTSYFTVDKGLVSTTATDGAKSVTVKVYDNSDCETEMGSFVFKSTTGADGIGGYVSGSSTLYTDYAGGFIDRYNTRMSTLSSKFDKNSATDNGVGRLIYMGDSFFDTGYFSNFYNLYEGKNAVTVGISSAQTYDLDEWMSTYLLQYQPKTVVIHIGTNDIWDGGSKIIARGEGTTSNLYQVVAQNVIDVFEYIHATLPDTKIYWYSIEYRTYNSGALGTNTKACVKNTNARVKAYCDANSYVTYLDSFTPSVDSSDNIISSVFRDGVHPTLQNYTEIYLPLLVNAGANLDQFNKKAESCHFVELINTGSFTHNVSAGTISATYSSGDREHYLMFNGETAYGGSFMVSGKMTLGSSGWAGLFIDTQSADRWFSASSAFPVANIVFSDKRNQIWGYNAGGANITNATLSSTSNIPFTVIAYNGKIIFDVNGAVNTFYQSNSKLYLSIRHNTPSLSLSNLVFQTSNTAIAAKAQQYENAYAGVSDITISSSKSWGTNGVAVTLGGSTLSRNFVLQGNAKITSIGSNAHWGFEFGGSDYRCILWERNGGSTGKFKVVMGVSNGSGGSNWLDVDSASFPAEDIIDFVGTGSLSGGTITNGATIPWKIVVTNNDAYFYVNNDLKVVYCNIDSGKAFAISGENMNGTLTSIKAYDGASVTYANAVSALPSVGATADSQTANYMVRV